MPPTIITSANTSACSSSRAPSKAYHSQEHREYGASKSHPGSRAPDK